LFTIFRLTRSKNIWMDFIECEKVYSTFKDDQFYLQKKGFCKIDIDNDQDICYLKLNPHISMRILSINFPILNFTSKTIGKRNLLKFECIELENQINFFLNDGH
ncbi:hypothetical protein BpHYR1_005849, partial [Brachionus plicatilis]